MKQIIVFFIVSLFSSLAFSQIPFQQKNQGEILLAFDKLRVVGSVLYIAAHPDDENTRLLSYFSLGKKYRVAYLSLTRGDGGQNLLGGELGQALGVIRTEELLEARKIDGAEQYFSRAIDFGYSKSATETIEIWNENEILHDMVWVIRKFKPDVIITRFPTEGRSHGHHIASAILASKAFDYAADKTKFSSQLKYTESWQAKSLYWNTYRFGRFNTTSIEQTHFEVGKFNRYLGKSYGEIASESRSMHKSQGFGTSSYRDSRLEFLKHLKGLKSTNNDPFENINTRLKNFSSEVENADAHILVAKKQFLSGLDSLCIDRLFKARKILEKENTNHVFDKKIEDIESLILSISGLWIETIGNKSMISHKDTLHVTSNVILRNKKVGIHLNKVSYKGRKDTVIHKKLKPFKKLSHALKVYITPSSRLSSPYWLVNKAKKGTYVVDEPSHLGLPKTLPYLHFIYSLQFGEYHIDFLSPILYRWNDAKEGEQYTDVHVVPPVSIQFNKDRYFTKSKKTSVKVSLTLLADSLKGKLFVKAPIGYTIKPDSVAIDLKDRKQQSDYHFTLQKIEGAQAVGKIAVYAHVKTADNTYHHQVQKIAYPHIATNYILNEAKADIPNFTIRKSTGRIGYIEGAGDRVDETLAQFYDVDAIRETDVLNGNLSKYKAIVLGIRAHNTNTWLSKTNRRLMEYVRNGGKLIVQYNTNNFSSRINYNIGPFPFTISRNRVSDETAPVVISLPNDKLFHSPNEITEKDWEGWVQERGIYFAEKWEEHYKSFLEMGDPGEQPVGGSLIGARHGEGYFFYTGISFFRQLPAGVEGAHKLLINMIEY